MSSDISNKLIYKNICLRRLLVTNILVKIFGLNQTSIKRSLNQTLEIDIYNKYPTTKLGRNSKDCNDQ